MIDLLVCTVMISICVNCLYIILDSIYDLKRWRATRLRATSSYTHSQKP